MFYPEADRHGLTSRRCSGCATRPTCAAAPDVDRDWNEWGPYLHFQAVLAQPIYTFGRAAAGKRAARARVEVERARVTAARNLLALEVRKLYCLHLYAHSMRPALDSAARDPGQGRREGQRGVRGQHRQGDQRGHPAAGVRPRRAGQVPHPGGDRRGPGAGGAEAHHGAAPERGGGGRRRDVARPAREPARPGGAAEEGLGEPPRVDPAAAGQAGGAVAGAVGEAGQRPGGVPGRPVLRRLDPHAPRREEPLLLRSLQPGVRRRRPRACCSTSTPARPAPRPPRRAACSTQVEGLEKFAGTGIPMEVRKAHDDAVQAKRIAAVRPTARRPRASG